MAWSDPVVALLNQLPLAALFGGLLVLLIGTLVMNRGNRWVLNVMAQDEPLILGFGTLLFLLGAGPTVLVGLALTEVVGLVVFVIAFLSRYTLAFNINEVVG